MNRCNIDARSSTTIRTWLCNLLTGPDAQPTWTVFNRSLRDNEDVAKGLADFQIVCLMRERTPFSREVTETLPNLRLLVTTGRRNAAIDMEAAKDRTCWFAARIPQLIRRLSWFLRTCSSLRERSASKARD